MSTAPAYAPPSKVYEFHLFGQPGGVYINEMILYPLLYPKSASLPQDNFERQITISRVHKFSSQKFLLEESNIDFQLHKGLFVLHSLLLTERFGVNVQIKDKTGYFQFTPGSLNHLLRFYTPQGAEFRIEFHARASAYQGYSGLIDGNVAKYATAD